MACRYCSAKYWLQRHQRLLKTFVRTLQRHGIYTRELDRSECPLSDKQHGGSDALVCTPQRYHVDIKCVLDSTEISTQRAQNHASRKFNKTIAHYREFEQQTSWKTLPFVMTVFGTVVPQTQQLMEDIFRHSASAKALRVQLYSHMQAELIRFHTDHLLLRRRHVAQNSGHQIVIENQIDDGISDNEVEQNQELT